MSDTFHSFLASSDSSLAARQGELQRQEERLRPQAEAERREIGARTKRLVETPPPRIPLPSFSELPPRPSLPEADPLKMFGTAGFALATLGSLLTRQPLATALRAAAGAATAFRKGQLDQANRLRTEWLDNLEEAVRQNQTELERYRLALASAGTDRAAQFANIQALAAAHKDTSMELADTVAGRDALLKLRIQHGDTLARIAAFARLAGARAAPATVVFNALRDDWMQRNPGKTPPPDLQQQWLIQSRAGFGVAPDPTSEKPLPVPQSEDDTVFGQNEQGLLTGLIPGEAQLLEEVPIVGEFMGAPQMTAARERFKVAKRQLVVALQNNPRFSEGERKAIEQEIDVSPREFDTSRAFRDRLFGLDDALKLRIHTEENVIRDIGVSARQRQAAAAARQAIINFRRLLGVPPHFKSAKEAHEAQLRGEIKSGDRVYINSELNETP